MARLRNERMETDWELQRATGGEDKADGETTLRRMQTLNEVTALECACTTQCSAGGQVCFTLLVTTTSHNIFPVVN